jgi:hypothetical protein
MLLYPWRKSPQYPLGRRLGGQQSQYGWYGKWRTLTPLSSRYTDCAITAPYLSYTLLTLHCTYQTLDHGSDLFYFIFITNSKWHKTNLLHILKNSNTQVQFNMKSLHSLYMHFSLLTTLFFPPFPSSLTCYQTIHWGCCSWHLQWMLCPIAILYILHTHKQKQNKQNKLHGLSPRANYTDRATAACRRADLPTFADRGCHVVSVTDPYGRILGFLDRSCYFSIK